MRLFKIKKHNCNDQTFDERTEIRSLGESKKTLLGEETYDNEGETTLLGEETYDNEGETTLLSEENFKNEASIIDRACEDFEDEEYEGQTSLLSEEESPYFNSYQYGDMERTENRYTVDDDGATTLLSSEAGYEHVGMELPETAPDAYMVRIIQSEKFHINKIKFLVGSEKEEVDCYIQNNSVSRKHAFIIYNSGNYYLMDNKSTNKTFLDGTVLEPLNSVLLYNGALIQFADELFQFICK